MTWGRFVLDKQGEDDLLREALQTVRDQSVHMQRAADTDEEADVLKHATELLRELRTSLLSPKNYYQLFMQILDEFRHFESYVNDKQQAGASIRALYERVQSRNNGLPRLYLLVAVGAVYIKSQEAPARDILTDLAEMLKGVQHPLRGLFLRHYVSLRVREKLPETGSVCEQSSGGTVSDAINFLLQNLQETTQLWIRLQPPKTVGSRPLAGREKERMELRLLVGTSLVRLSQMEGVTLSVYTDQVLPRLLDEIVLASIDSIAQQYLMECIIQVFPDEFHFHNLEKLLNTMEKLQANVDVALTLTALCERFIKFRETVIKAGQQEQIIQGTKVDQRQTDHQVFQQLLASIANLLLRLPRSKATINPESSYESSALVQLGSVLPLFVTFASFTLMWLGISSKSQNPGTTSAVQQILALCLTFLHERAPTWHNANDVTCQLKALALTLLEVLSIQDLVHTPALVEVLALLPWQGAWKDVALAYIRILLSRHERIHDANQMDVLLQVLTPLVRDDPAALESPFLATKEIDSKHKAAFEAEQQMLAKVLHLVMNEDLDIRFRVFSVARRAFLQSGVFRIRFTLVPLIYQSLTLVRELAARCREPTPRHERESKTALKTERTVSTNSKVFQTTPYQVLQFVHEMVTALASEHDAVSVSCVHLFLQSALIADGCAYEAVACEFITRAFIVYEDQILRSQDQWRALELMVAFLRATCNLSSANYESLATKTTQYAARLLKKKDQALMVLHCAHLFWHPCQRDGKRVRECLQRSLCIADALKDTLSNQDALFLDILEAYLYFYEAQTPEVTHKYLVGLRTLVKDHLENMEHGQRRREGEFRYRAIVRYMDALSFSDDASLR